MRSSRPAGWALLLTLPTAPAHALSQVPGPIEIGPSWGQLEPDHSASLYTTIVNHGVLADRLTGGACSGFGNATLAGLDQATQGDAAQEKGVLVGPGATARLQPHFAHLALADADRATDPGALISCTLSFVHSGQRIVIFRMAAPGPATPEP